MTFLIYSSEQLNTSKLRENIRLGNTATGHTAADQHMAAAQIESLTLQTWGWSSWTDVRQPWQSMFYTFQWASISPEPWISVREFLPLGKSCLYRHHSTVLLLSATMLSFCSCHVFLVETGRSNSCLNCSLTGRRCWENQTETTLSLLHCTAFSSLSSLFALSLSPSLPLFAFSLTDFFFSVDPYFTWLKWQVS